MTEAGKIGKFQDMTTKCSIMKNKGLQSARNKYNEEQGDVSRLHANGQNIFICGSQ